MAFSIPNNAFQLQSTRPDLGSSLNEGVKQGMAPRSYAEQLLSSMLANKIKGIEAQYAPQKNEASINHLNAQTTNLGDEHGMAPLRRKILESTINKNNYEAQLNNLLFVGNNGSMGQEGGQGFTGPAEKKLEGRSSATMPNIVNQGNPDLYHLDEAYDSNPLSRQLLVKKGYKKTQSTKYDPNTGITTTITTQPSGKVSVTTSEPDSGRKVPLTQKTRSALQIQKNAIPQLREIIDKLKSTPSPFEPNIPYGLGNLWHPADRAAHKSLVNIGKDLFVKAKGINATDKTLETGEKVLERGSLEKDSDYHKRLNDFLKTLDDEESQVNSALSSGITTKSDNETKPKKYDPKHYEQPEGSVGLWKDGELYFFPETQVKMRLAQGYEYD